MKAIQVSQTGGPEVLSYVDVPQPSPGAGQVLIKAEAIGVNFVDTYYRSGTYPRELPFIPGFEVCGTVEAIGADVSAVAVGDRVASADVTGNGGAYAEYSLAPADLVAKVPDALASDVVASSLLRGQTTHALIKSVYTVQSGETILVHAGAGGVGLILTQWATALGARVLTTVSSPQKAEASRQAGAVEVLDYPEPDDPEPFAAKIRDLTDGQGVPVVYDGVGRATFDASLASLAVRGTLALFGGASGPVPPFDPQRLNAAGSVYLTRPNLLHFIRTADEFVWRATEFFDAVADGTVTINVAGRYPLAEVGRAHQDLEARKITGSVVLMP